MWQPNSTNSQFGRMISTFDGSMTEEELMLLVLGDLLTNFWTAGCTIYTKLPVYKCTRGQKLLHAISSCLGRIYVVPLENCNRRAHNCKSSSNADAWSLCGLCTMFHIFITQLFIWSGALYHITVVYYLCLQVTSCMTFHFLCLNFSRAEFIHTCLWYQI